MTEENELTVAAELTVSGPTSVVRVRGGGDALYVDARSFRGLREFLEESPLGGRLPALDSALSTEVICRVRGAPVLRLGGDGASGVGSRLLGVAPARLDALGIVRALLRR